MNKYELTNETINHLVRPLYRIRALKDFADVKAGDFGGYIEKESNLSQDGIAWVYGNARVYGSARVCDSALVYGRAWVGDSAHVCDDAQISSDFDYLYFRGFGREAIPTTIFRTKDNAIMVKCGCFEGDLQQFEKQVHITHAGTKHEKEYMGVIASAKAHFEV